MTLMRSGHQEPIDDQHFPEINRSVVLWRRGGMAERLNALVLKTSEGESPPRVRISLPPPESVRPPRNIGRTRVNLFKL